MHERSIEVRCTGCGGTLSELRLREDAPAEAEELLARIQEGPPFCVVCSCRTMASPRPGIEFWERAEEQEEQGVDVEVQAVDLHDGVGY